MPSEGVARDITERQKLEEQLRQSQKMEAIGLLAGGLAHDFNNMLTVIMGYADLILDDDKPADPTIEKIGQVKRAAEHAAALTGQPPGLLAGVDNWCSEECSTSTRSFRATPGYFAKASGKILSSSLIWEDGLGPD